MRHPGDYGIFQRHKCFLQGSASGAFEAGPSGISPWLTQNLSHQKEMNRANNFKESNEDRKSMEMTPATESAGDKEIPIIELDLGEDTDHDYDDNDHDEETENDEPDGNDIKDVDLGILEGVNWEQGKLGITNPLVSFLELRDKCNKMVKSRHS